MLLQWPIRAILCYELNVPKRPSLAKGLPNPCIDLNINLPLTFKVLVVMLYLSNQDRRDLQKSEHKIYTVKK
jgi:hypothetical protein